MKFEQNTLIYIDEQDKTQASAVAKAFANKDVKNRVFVNILGAELAGKYLTSEGIAISPVDNLHNIRKVLEELDIADVILPKTHIDVRVIFDENYIFIPKSHFDLKIQPHIYFVFELAKDISHVKFLGFFESSAVDLNCQNEKYYFYPKEKLIPVENLKAYLDSAKTSTRTELSDEELENFEQSIIEMIDNDINLLDKKILLKVLTKNQDLRNKFIEFENFELISYKTVNELEFESEIAPQTYTDKDFQGDEIPKDEFEIFEKDEKNIKNLSQTEDVTSEEICNDINGEYSANNPENENYKD